jgi:hypothetical protein
MVCSSRLGIPALAADTEMFMVGPNRALKRGEGHLHLHENMLGVSAGLPLRK